MILSSVNPFEKMKEKFENLERNTNDILLKWNQMENYSLNTSEMINEGGQEKILCGDFLVNAQSIISDER